MEFTQQAYSTDSSHKSWGPFIAVFSVITILTIMAVMIGRLCSGKKIWGYGYGHYDLEAWIERKCFSCIDGRIDPSTTQQQQQTNIEDSVPVVIPIDPPEDETEQETEQSQTPQHSSS
ncbi:hypothetical protein AQUCO_01000287v1 [Aquilegia coerulea]|uniref:Uncharacterized protein n=1 Tax=Aquilegia coerulea TaxID=218851 RepID=A0A2G5E974_AQUCA|nr:hypothetical protein AQUCO_01000287v1 [Aquilegia coerulea]